jgi:hypothetical protein
MTAVRRSLLLPVLLAGTILLGGASAQEGTPAGRPAGLAARYPADRGLRDDPDVLLFEDFDGVDLRTVVSRWDESSNSGDAVLSLSDDVPAPVSGANRRSLQLTAHPGRDNGGNLYRQLPRGVDELFLRFYVKFPAPAGYVHHFVHIGGYNPPTRWPQGGAGKRPRGDERVTVGIEPDGHDGRSPPPGEWNFYAYWHEMKQSSDGRFWGNGLSPAIARPVPANRWQCVEMRLKLNNPGRRDGMLALWLDGKPVADIHRGVRRGPWSGMGFKLRSPGQAGEPFEGFDFRTSEDLKLNFVWLLHYVTDTIQQRNQVAERARPCVARFDQIVAATRYIGPIQAASGSR